MVIISKTYKAGSGKFMRLLFAHYGLGWISGAVFLVIISLILGFLVDYRIFIASFLLICLGGPVILMELYFRHGLKGENYYNISDHRLEIGEDSLTIVTRYEIMKEEKKLSDDPDEIWIPHPVPLDLLGKYIVGNDYVIFPYLDEKRGFIYIPREAFESDSDYMNAIIMIASGKKHSEE